MFTLCARILKSIFGNAARGEARVCDPAERANADARTNDRAADWLPPVLGSAEWPLAYMIDRSCDWYLDRR